MNGAHRRKVIKGDDSNYCIAFFYERDVILNRPAAKPIHCVAVSNRGTDGQIAYAEYFGLFRWVRLASSNTAADIHCAYALDPISGEPFEPDIDLELTRQEVDGALTNTQFPGEAVRRAADQVIPPVIARKHHQQLQEVISNGLRDAWANCGGTEGEPLYLLRSLKFGEYCGNDLNPIYCTG